MVALPPINTLTLEAIEAAQVAKNAPRFPRSGLGGSTIGHGCERHLWYRFRWAARPQEFSGRMLRLFETGHKEEARMIGWLREAGCEVADIDPETGEQWLVLACDGHFKGFADGKVQGLREAPKTKHLLECKTHNRKSFEQLQKHGLAASKPEHLAQMQIYMHLLGLERGFYLAKCKDDDTLYSERVHYDAAHACVLMAKAQAIVAAHAPPPRVSDKPDYFLCKAYSCPHYGVCHEQERALRNCRTCLHSSPVEEGKWHCARHNQALSYEEQQAGCPHHLYLPALVDGEQIDVDEVAETVTYKRPDGSIWVDGCCEHGRAREGGGHEH